jgi:hypothetical protein
MWDFDYRRQISVEISAAHHLAPIGYLAVELRRSNFD